jgi:hypothetical protein
MQSFLAGPSKGQNSRLESERYWIPGQARNDKLHRIYVVMHNEPEAYLILAHEGDRYYKRHKRVRGRWNVDIS